MLLACLASCQEPIIEERFYRIKSNSSGLNLEGSTEIWGEVLCNGLSSTIAQIWEFRLVSDSTDTYIIECNHGDLVLAGHNVAGISLKVGPFDPTYYSERFTLSSAGNDFFYMRSNRGGNYVESASAIGASARNQTFDGGENQKWIFEPVAMDFGAPQYIRTFNLTNAQVEMAWSPTYAPSGIALYEVFKNDQFLGSVTSPDTSYTVFGLD